MGRPVVTEHGPATDCVYVTAGWGIHDDRWLAGLQAVGFSPRAISLGREAADAVALRAAVESAASGERPVLAGPLHSVTRTLVGIDAPLVGLSWGYDVDELVGTDAGWLADLDGLIVDSAANRALAVGQGLSDERITFLPWGIDLDRFPADGPTLAPSDLDLPDDAQLLVSLRAHEPIYRVGDIIDAFVAVAADQPQSALVVGHSGSLTESFRSTVRDAGLDARVRFIGTVPEGDLAPLLRAATAYVTASVADGTSVTLLQAMACGAPVVASDTAGNLGWINADDTGLLFPVGDVAALATCLAHACSDDLSEFTDRARDKVERDGDWPANLPRLRRAMDDAAQA